MIGKSHAQNSSIHGFTLVELLIAMVVALLVSAAVFASYKVQQQTHTAQMQVTEIQQNLRAAIEMMSHDFHYAGYDPTYSGEYGVEDGTSWDKFLFTADLCENGGTPQASAYPSSVCPTGAYTGQPFPEKYAYSLVVSGNADADDTTSLQRTAVVDPFGNPVPVAENIEFVEFLYILDDGSTTLAPSPAVLPSISSVRVTLVGRADEPDYKYTNTDTYPRGSGGLDFDPPDDNFRRRSVIKTIEIRNMGII